MNRPPARRPRALAPLAALLALAVAAPAATAAPRPDDRIPGRYVVVYEDSVRDSRGATQRRERAHGFRARHRYAHAIKGFSARLSAAQVRALRRDPAVDHVAPDRRVRAVAALAGGETVPVGIRRVGAATSTDVHAASGAGVAVLDTGIDLNHPDLSANAAHGVNCIDSTRSAQDDHGHGTHVAGTIAAANGGSGVVGIAPGTRLHAVKVLDSRGNGSTSTVVCGIDWVTRNAAAKGIRVANMSLGGAGAPVASCATTTDPEHAAICRSSDPAGGGVVYAVAAGNSGWDFDYLPQPDIPAAYPQVVTVAAMGDTDGQPGALGSGCSREKDDRYTSWSNYAARSTGDWPGAPHTMAAPGLCVSSTKLGGGTTSMSGTSMAAPHVAGALALCIDEAGASGPCATLASNDPVSLIAAVTSREAGYGFAGDPSQPVSGRYFGYLLSAPLSGGTTEPEPEPAPEDPAAPIALTASGYKVKGWQRVELRWSGATTTGVDVHRNGAKVATTANDGVHVDEPGSKGGGSYRYRICDAGSTTACSPEVTVTF